MQTPSEAVQGSQSAVPSRERAARTDTPKRSVFGNYDPGKRSPLTPALSPSEGERENRSQSNRDARGEEARSAQSATLQTSIDLAIARSFIYRFIAKAYEDPTPGGWQWLCDPATQENLRAAWAFHCRTGGAPVSDVPDSISTNGDRRDACPTFAPDFFDLFHSAYLAAFGHAARGSCPLNEIEYGDLKADPLFQPHRLADLAAFYRAFGLEVAADADERHDHICLELEFMCVLAAKEAYALENQLDAEELAVCREAQKKFLREHLGRWTPAFARRLLAATTDPSLTALAEFTKDFIESDCARFGVTPGSEDLRLRAVDEASESMCASCGISNLPPGATGTT